MAEIKAHRRRYVCSDELPLWRVRKTQAIPYGPFLFLPDMMKINWSRLAGTPWKMVALVLEGPRLTAEGAVYAPERLNRMYEPDMAPPWALRIADKIVPPYPL